MKNIVGVRFKRPGKIYFFDSGNLKLNYHDKVIVETSMGEDLGEVASYKRNMPEYNCLFALELSSLNILLLLVARCVSALPLF